MLALLLFAGPAIAATLTVGEGESYATIQEAVEAASDGDTVLVAAGTYTECVDFGGLNLTLRGEAGSEETWLISDGTCSQALLLGAGETATIEGLSISNPDARAVEIDDGTVSFVDVAITDSGNDEDEGGGVAIVGGLVSFEGCTLDGNTGSLGGNLFAMRGTSLTLTDSTVSGGSANVGGGIYIGYDGGGASSITLDNVVVEGNSANLWGAGVFLDDHTSFVSRGSTVADNAGTSPQGAGIYAAAYATLSSTDDVFSGNHATDYASISTRGGAIYLESNNTLAIEGGAFTANLATRGGAIYAGDGAVVTIRDATLSGNQADDGGAIYLDSNATLGTSSGALSGNGAVNGGGAIHAGEGSSVALLGTLLADNTAGTQGGALYAYASLAVVLEDVVFDGNQATDGGGAAYIDAPLSDATLLDVRFTDNESTRDSGGGLYARSLSSLWIEGAVFEGNTASWGGGGLLARDVLEVEVSGSTFDGNTAGYDGGGGLLFDAEGEDAADLSVTDSVFTDNESRAAGGGIRLYYADEVTLTGSRFARNRTSSTSEGGAVAMLGAPAVTASHNAFCLNQAQHGGALYLYNPGGVGGGSRWTNNLFIENEAEERGGAIALYYEYDISLVNNTFVGNTASQGGALHVWYATPGFINNIVAWTRDGNGVYVTLRRDGGGSVFVYNGWYENEADHAGGCCDPDAEDGNVVVDPGFVDYALDGDCDNDDLHLSEGSALIDAGDPSILDPDGSVSDIGAYGGPEAADTRAPDTDTEEDTGARTDIACDGCASSGSSGGPLGLALALIGLARARPYPARRAASSGSRSPIPADSRSVAAASPRVGPRFTITTGRPRSTARTTKR